MYVLDATSFEHKGSRYYVWAQKDPAIDGNSNLYISRMSNPWTLCGPQTMISTPEYDWEQMGFKVNEGPAFLKKGEQIFLTYSASATDDNYCMGLLEADGEADLLQASSWRKCPFPVLTTDERVGMYGPGHNSFTVGDPLYDPNRHTFVRELSYTDEERPDFRGSLGIQG